MTHDPLCPEPDYPIARKCPSCQNYSTVREDMLRRCEEAAYIDLLALEDDIREAFGKGSDAARIVAGYRSVMPGFQQFYEEKQ